MTLDLQHYKNRHSLKSKIGRVIWNVTWLMLARWTPDRKWRILLLRMFGAKIGWRCAVRSSSKIRVPWNLECGDCSFGEYCDIYAVDKIAIGDRVVISRGAFLCCARHGITSPIMELTHAPTTIGHDAWIASRAVILPGVTIGEGAVVGCAAVVAKDVPPWSVVVGNPARVVGKREIKENK